MHLFIEHTQHVSINAEQILIVRDMHTTNANLVKHVTHSVLEITQHIKHTCAQVFMCLQKTRNTCKHCETGFMPIEHTQNIKPIVNNDSCFREHTQCMQSV